MQKILKNKQGFTLIELMVVISIIAILTVLFINSSTINIQRGRDAKRKTDLENIRSGLEIYRSDCNSYPLAITFGSSLKGSGATTNCPASNTYITSVPQDPTGGNGSPSYVYWSDGVTYELCSSEEAGIVKGNPQPPQTPTPTVSCNGSSACGASDNCYYKVANP